MGMTTDMRHTLFWMRYIVPQNNDSNHILNIKFAIHKVSAGVSRDILDTLPIC